MTSDGLPHQPTGVASRVWGGLCAHGGARARFPRARRAAASRLGRGVLPNGLPLDWLLIGSDDLPHQVLPNGSAALAAAVVGLYSRSLGAWAWPVVATSAACAMLGTCITILDAYARIISRSLQVRLSGL